MSTTAETQEAETPTDGPLLDLTDAGVKRFIKQAKARGYVTMDELNKVLPSEEVTSEQIEDTLAMLSEMGVNVVENEESDGESEGGEVAVREESAVAVSEKAETYDRTDDPVRMYLREMGSAFSDTVTDDSSRTATSPPSPSGFSAAASASSTSSSSPATCSPVGPAPGTAPP